MQATFYTIADSTFFVGAVALLNSLRLTGNDGELVLVDCGLTARQRELLSPHCRLTTSEGHGRPTKPAVHRLAAGELVALLDSDIMVT